MIAQGYGNGQRVEIRVGRQGPPGPVGPVTPFGQPIDMTVFGSIPTLLLTLPGIPAGKAGVQLVEGYVMAQDQASAGVCAFQVVALLKQDAAGNLSLAGDPTNGNQAPNPSVTQYVADVAMEGCGLALSVGMTGLMVVGTGVAGLDVRWIGTLMVAGNNS
jgi:hypothetical protein